MPIQQHHVDRLREIIQKEQGKNLTNEEAWETARRLYHLFRLLLWGIVEGEEDNDKEKGSIG